MGDKDDQFENFLKKMAQVQEQMTKQQEQTNQMILAMMKSNNCRSASNNGPKGSQSNNFGFENQSNKVMRPTQPTFLPKHGSNHGGEEQSLVEGDINASMEAYMQIDLEIRHQLPFIQFHNIRNGSKGSQVTYHPNKDLQHRVSKLTLPTFDGLGKMTVQSWIQKLDTYFSLNPMTGEEAIKFSILHLEGLAHEWQHHGIVIQGFGQVSTYAEFTHKLT